MQSKRQTLRLARRAAAGILMGVVFSAQAETGRGAFEQGLEAAAAGDNQAALRHFEQARAAGLDNGALHYNLGVVYYKLGRYADAKAAFGQLTDHPTLSALAYFNLGLIANRRGDEERALSAFTRAAERTDDPKLAALAKARIEALHAIPTVPIQRWAGAVSLGAGTDDALQDPAEQITKEVSDQFAELFAVGTGVISGAPGDGWRMDLSAYGTRYQSFSEYDMSTVNGAITRVVPLDHWRLEVGAGAEQSSFGGEDYLREGQLSLLARLPAGRHLPGYRLRYRYHAIQSLNSAFDPQEGSRHDVDLEVQWLGSAGHLGLAYGLEINDREDHEAAGLFTSYSPTRHGITLQAATDSGPWRWTGDVGYRASRYDGTTVLADGRRIEREDERLRGTMGLDYRLSPHWQLDAEYSRTENDSNIMENDYDQNLFTVGVTGFF